MKKTKRFLISITLALVLVLSAALPVLADTYLSYYPITITDTSGAARTGYPVLLTTTGQALIDAGLVSSSGLNSRVSIGDASVAANNIPYTITTTKIPVWIETLPANGQAEIRLYTGYSPNASGYDILVGDGGKITVSDDDDLELGDTFEIELDNVYLDTGAGGTKNIVYKQDAFRVYVSGAGEITATIPYTDSATLQPSVIDTQIFQSNPNTNYGGDTYLDISNLLNNAQRSMLEFDISSIAGATSIDSAVLSLYYYTFGGDDPAGVETWAYKLTRTDWVELEATWTNYKAATAWTAAGGDYVTVTPAGDNTNMPAAYGWMTWTITAITQDALDNADPVEVLVKFTVETVGSATDSYALFYSREYAVDEAKRPKLAIDYTAEKSVTATNVVSGEHDIKVWADGTDLFISIDSAVAGTGYDTASLDGVSVDLNNNDWLIMDNSTTQFMSYMEYYKHTTAVGGSSLKAHYKPATMISGATLLDLTAGAENGTITWGTNANVTLTYGEIVNYTATASTVGEEAGYDVPEADMPAQWYGSGSNIANLPLYPMMANIATQTGIPCQTLYLLMVVTMCFAFAVVGFVTFNSVMMSLIGVTLALGIGTSMTIVPMWITLTFLITGIGTIYLKGRSGL